MKKTTNQANAIISAMFAGTATTSKTLFLLFFAGVTLMFSSCSRSGVGCNSFACKSNLKYSNEHKYQKYTVNMYKCPTRQEYSR